jgi:hypothetical protein
MVDSPPPLTLPGRRPTNRERVLTGPYELYLRGNESLRLTSWNSLVGVVLALQGRFLTSENVWSELRESHTPNTDRSPRTQVYQVAGSLVSNLVLFAEVGAPFVGQTFVKLELVQGDGAAATVLGVVLQGYVTNNVALAWPGSPVVNSLDGGGYHRVLNGALPAVGGPWFETVPSNARWELTSALVPLSTDAVAGVRVVYFRLFDPVLGGGPFFYASQNQPPSTAFTYKFAPGVTGLVEALASNVTMGIPLRMMFAAGQAIYVANNGPSFGDQFGQGAYTVREWIVP